MKFTITNVVKEIEASLKGIRDPIAEAATSAVREASDHMKIGGRSNIAGAGFSVKWQNAWRVKMFPTRGVSIDAKAWGYHKIPYSLIFEDGGTITGKKGLLWIPLPSVKKGGGRFRDSSPAALIRSGVKLFTMHEDRGPPLLGAEVRVPKSQAGNDNLSVSLSQLRRGTGGKRGIVRAIPLFFGIPSVSIRKRFDIEGVAQKAQNEIPGLYASNLSP